jgi:hypothetical protein
VIPNSDSKYPFVREQEKASQLPGIVELIDKSPATPAVLFKKERRVYGFMDFSLKFWMLF